jgi:hypothetical protein
VSILASVLSEKLVEHEFAGAEVRFFETIQRSTEVCKAVFRRVSQHAQAAQDDEAMFPSLATGITVINEECVGGLFQRQGNSGSLARAETGTPNSNVLRRCLDDQPLRAVGEPPTDHFGRLLTTESVGAQ